MSLQCVATGTWMMDITQAACCLSGLVGTASYHPSCSSHAALTSVRRWGRNRLGLSNYLFRPLTVKTGKFVHAAPPPLLKWTARARTGALATRFRLEWRFRCRQSVNTLSHPAPFRCCQLRRLLLPRQPLHSFHKKKKKGRRRRRRRRRRDSGAKSCLPVPNDDNVKSLIVPKVRPTVQRNPDR